MLVLGGLKNGGSVTTVLRPECSMRKVLRPEGPMSTVLRPEGSMRTILDLKVL